jgi:serine palmitoyltransferase
MPLSFSKRSSRNHSSSPSPIAHPKGTSSSMLKRPMRNAASYLTALSQADADARARRISSDSEPSEPALSLRSSLHTDDDSSYLTTVDDSDDTYDDLDTPPHPPTSQQQFTTKHSEFGHCFNEAYRYTSAYKPGTTNTAHSEEPPYYILITTYVSYLILIVVGHLRDFVGKRLYPDAYQHLMPSNVSHFFTTILFMRIHAFVF